jgi:hypothetical protein
MMARRPNLSVKEKLKCVSCGKMWSSKVQSNQDVSNDIRVTELKSTIQTRKFLESQLHSTCVIQLYSIQVSITEVLAQYNHDNVHDCVDEDNSISNNNNNNNNM